MVQVQFWAPAAGGAGVSLVIAYLNGCAVPKLLNHRNLIAKWIGTILGVSSNLALGPEAPMVHLGASVAHVYTHFTCSEPPTSMLVLAPQLCKEPCTSQSQRTEPALVCMARYGPLSTMQALAAVLFMRWRDLHERIFCCINGKRRKEKEDDSEVPVAAIFQNDAERREFICAGAAAGIAVGSPKGIGP